MDRFLYRWNIDLKCVRVRFSESESVSFPYLFNKFYSQKFCEGELWIWRLEFWFQNYCKAETQSMIPDSKNRLKKACDDLDMLLVSVEYLFLVIYSSSWKIFCSSIEIIQLDVFFVEFEPAFEYVFNFTGKRTWMITYLTRFEVNLPLYFNVPHPLHKNEVFH